MTSLNRVRRSVPIVAMFLSALLLCGCTITIGTSPTAYPFPSEEVFDVQRGTSARISNFYMESTVIELDRGVFCDLQHFTATALVMVERELGMKGVVPKTDSSKSVVLKITKPEWTHGFATQTGALTLEVEFGNLQKLSFDVENKTGGNAMRAFNGAILRAATNLLKDERFAAYLNAAE